MKELCNSFSWYNRGISDSSLVFSWYICIYGILGKLEEGHFQREQNVLKLSEASYGTFLKCQRDNEDLLPDREVGSCNEDNEQQYSEDDRPADVVLLRIASGRPLIRPNRLDFSYITFTSCFLLFS